MFWIRLALGVLLAVVFVPVAALAGVSMMLGCVLLTSLLLASAVVVFPFLVGQPQMRLVRISLLVAVVTFGLLSRKVVLREVQSSLDRMSVRLNRTGERGLSVGNRLALYGFSLAMGYAGRLVYPEAAREHLYLHQRGPRIRRFDSSFPMQAPSVRDHVRDYAFRLTKAQPRRDRISLPEERHAFTYGKDPWRVALALNPIAMSGEAARENGEWVLHLVGRVPVSYPKSSRVTIPVPRVGELAVEEGLFHALQEAGMLHPYVAEYHWRVRAEDLLGDSRQ